MVSLLRLFCPSESTWKKTENSLSDKYADIPNTEELMKEAGLRIGTGSQRLPELSPIMLSTGTKLSDTTSKTRNNLRCGLLTIHEMY